MKVASVTVVNLQKDSQMPMRKGTMKPMVNAARVGRRKMGKYRLIAFSKEKPPYINQSVG